MGEVNFALSFKGWGEFGHINVDSQSGGRIQRKGGKCFQVESSISTLSGKHTGSKEIAKISLVVLECAKTKWWGKGSGVSWS